MDRGPGWYRSRAAHISGEVARLIDQILDSKQYPEQSYRSCDGILGLHRKVGSAQLTEAARLALEMDCCSYSFVNRLIQNGMAKPGKTRPSEPARLPEHANIRGKEYFQQTLNLK